MLDGCVFLMGLEVVWGIMFMLMMIRMVDVLMLL